jgi:tetratricopeptide (TPR) repeat protein
LQRAIQIDPGYWLAYDWYGLCLSGMGRSDEAIAAIRRAQQLDPVSLVIHHHSAWLYLHARRYDEAIEQCSKALEMDPNYPLGYLWAGLAYTQKSMHEKALAFLQKAKEYLGGIPYMLAALGHACASAGRSTEAQALLDQLSVPALQVYVDPYHVALVYSGLGEFDRAFECLEKAYQDRSMWLAAWTSCDPRLDPLRPDSRFPDLLRRIGVGL